MVTHHEKHLNYSYYLFEWLGNPYISLIWNRTLPLCSETLNRALLGNYMHRATMTAIFAWWLPWLTRKRPQFLAVSCTYIFINPTGNCLLCQGTLALGKRRKKTVPVTTITRENQGTLCLTKRDACRELLLSSRGRSQIWYSLKKLFLALLQYGKDCMGNGKSRADVSPEEKWLAPWHTSTGKRQHLIAPACWQGSFPANWSQICQSLVPTVIWHQTFNPLAAVCSQGMQLMC